LNVSELKVWIEDLDDDMEVYLYSDHGQEPYSLDCAALVHVTSLSYSPCLVHPDNVENYGDELFKVLLLESS